MRPHGCVCWACVHATNAYACTYTTEVCELPTAASLVDVQRKVHEGLAAKRGTYTVIAVDILLMLQTFAASPLSTCFLKAFATTSACACTISCTYRWSYSHTHARSRCEVASLGTTARRSVPAISTLAPRPRRRRCSPCSPCAAAAAMPAGTGG